MALKIKNKILEIASIAKECPENLQEKCFELLLKDFLDKQTPPKEKTNNKMDKTDIDNAEDKQDKTEKSDTPSQEDFSEKDLHVKAKRFLKTYGITLDHINQIFYKEGDKISPLFDDLKATTMSESQIRIAMLQALKSGISTGEFEFNGEDVRKECKIRKCYDSINFATNFKNNNTLFDNFEKYSKKNPVIRLNAEGKAELSVIVKDLQ